jgi:hypothetical protein
MTRPKAPPPPSSSVRLKQGYMCPGRGNRAGDGFHPLRECGRYSECLDAFLASVIAANKLNAARRPGQPYREVPEAAHCPLGCRWWEPAQHEGAETYVSLNGEAHGLPMLSGRRAG